MDNKGYGSKTSTENNYFKLLKDSVMNVQDLKKYFTKTPPKNGKNS